MLIPGEGEFEDVMRHLAVPYHIFYVSQYEAVVLLLFFSATKDTARHNKLFPNILKNLSRKRMAILSRLCFMLICLFFFCHGD